MDLKNNFQWRCPFVKWKWPEEKLYVHNSTCTCTVVVNMLIYVHSHVYNSLGRSVGSLSKNRLVSTFRSVYSACLQENGLAISKKKFQGGTWSMGGLLGESNYTWMILYIIAVECCPGQPWPAIAMTVYDKKLLKTSAFFCWGFFYYWKLERTNILCIHKM